MKNRNYNKIAGVTVTQINSTLDMLLNAKLAYSINHVPKIDRSKKDCMISWNNHIPDRNNSGKSFTSIGQYEYILRNNSYHCLMFDGSIIRVSFSFNDDFLISENLLWCPAPFADNSELLGDYTPQDLLEDFYGDKEWYHRLIMRTPIRIDFDSSKHETNHTAAHAHLQHHDTHIDVIKPICFNRFISLILNICYPSYKIKFENVDYIDYKIKKLRQIEEQPVQLLIR